MRCVVLIFFFCSAAFAAGRYTLHEDHASGGSSPLLLVLRDADAGLEAAIAPSEGGELSSLRVRHKGEWIELLYHGRDYTPREGWRGKAPFLWPATGRNFAPSTAPVPDTKEGSYEWNGERYPMPIHGFAKDLPWKVESRRAGADGAAAVLSLSDTDRTRRWYPFGFRLTVEYRLAEGRLAIRYTVAAPRANPKPMFFSAGNHITFRAPFLAGSDAAAMTLESPSTMEYVKSAGGIPTGASRPRTHAMPVRMGGFEKNAAVSLGGYKEMPYMVLADPGGLALRITNSASTSPAEPVVRFNMWGDVAAGFFSPEPWVGLQNSLNSRGGLVLLKSGESWEWKLEISFTGS